MGARAWPFGCLCPGPDCLGCGTRFAQTVLAPTNRARDWGAATPGGAREFGARGWRGYNYQRQRLKT